jgi:hypothetical protein
MASAWLEAGKRRELAPGEACRRVPRSGRQQLSCSGMKDRRGRRGVAAHWRQASTRVRLAVRRRRRRQWRSFDRYGSRAGGKRGNGGEAGIKFAVFLFEVGNARAGGGELFFEAHQAPIVFF